VKREIKLTNNLFLDYGEAIEQVLRRAVQHALLMHKRLGNPVAIWKDGKVIVLAPDEIAFDDSPECSSAKVESTG
jgi:hypothetical protein